MLIESSESTVLQREYESVFGRIDSDNQKQLANERRALAIMRELQRLDILGKKIKKEGKIDKIANFNKKYIELKVALNNLFRQNYA